MRIDYSEMKLQLEIEPLRSFVCTLAAPVNEKYMKIKLLNQLN